MDILSSENARLRRLSIGRLSWRNSAFNFADNLFRFVWQHGRNAPF
jgi:hypothetical protein